MPAICRFVDEEGVRARRAGCPLAVLPASTDESACAGCPHNAAWPGEATIGCRVALPGPIWRAATTQLGEENPKLLHDVHALRGRDVGADEAAEATAVLARWVQHKGINDEGLEAARTAQAFVRCMQRTGSAVRLWE